MSGMNKAERLTEMKRLYIQRGYSDIEMAERLGIRRETVFRDRKELETEYPFIQDNSGRWRIDRSRFLSEIKVDLHEALTLYLAARKTSRQTRFYQPHAASAVEKLAATLRQPMTERLLKTADRLLKQERDPERIKTIQTLAQAWVEQRKVRIRYQGLKSAGITNHVISPYFIEPSIWSDSMYVVAHTDTFEKIMPFKIERIQTAVLSGEPFDLPEDFDDEQLLKYAWGIWYGDEDPITVKLRFSADATRRVKESIWHPLEKVIDTEDGGCIWSADVAEWREMLPWVRGWGADCEVLEPEDLRNALTHEAQALAELYKLVEERVKQMVYYGHSRKDKVKSEWQPLIEHLTKTADLAEKFGVDAGISELARTAALLHDIGKYSKAFQARLDGSKRKVDHATAGAKEIRSLFNKDQNQKSLADMLAYCIAGHHTGLPDYGDSTDVDGAGTLLARVEKKPLKDFSAYKTEIDANALTLPAHVKIRSDKKQPGFSFAFLTRMIFSALVDADFQETETYYNQGEKPRGGYDSIKELCQKFRAHLQKFDNPESDINKKRTETLKACIEKANLEQGFFKLTIPTGGGKTLASMAFALNHAVEHDLKRIIYVIPFTSIIEQNAGIFKDCLGEENVLEHHSNFDWKKKSDENTEDADDETKDVTDKLKLASENWDIPIIVTTNVQFFESLFANKSSRCRKLHNLAKSVIIFDEAQMLPREYMKPCMLAVKELVQNYGASTVFCTATQPSLDRFLENVEFTDLAPDPQALFDFYKRVQVKNIGRVPDADLIEKIKAYPQALCIVNTRKHAKGLFDMLEEDGRFHLSALMCPTHRKEKLLEILERLKSGQPCCVISTQVMEAGIDIDFPVGFRALAGLDSIIQAAGRINRERKNPNGGDIFVFEPDSLFIKQIPHYIELCLGVTRVIVGDDRYSKDPTTIAAINAYFNRLYNSDIQDEKAFDSEEILSFCKVIERKSRGKDDIYNFAFKTVAKKFKLIKEDTVAVIIPHDDEAKGLIKNLTNSLYPPIDTVRSLQRYTVNIYEREFQALQNMGAILPPIAETYFVLNESKKAEYYYDETGLLLPENSGGEGIFA